jgi:hypothetical protein
MSAVKCAIVIVPSMAGRRPLPRLGAWPAFARLAAIVDASGTDPGVCTRFQRLLDDLDAAVHHLADR